MVAVPHAVQMRMLLAAAGRGEAAVPLGPQIL